MTLYPPHPAKIADWRPAPAATQLVLPLATSRRGDWHYDGLPKPARISWAAVLLSAGLHGLLLWGFGHRPVRPQVAAVHAEPVIQLVMPPLDDDEEPPPRNMDEEMEETPGVVVPKLADLPTTVVLSDAFVQPLEMNIPLQTNFDKGSLTSIPLKIATSSQVLNSTPWNIWLRTSRLNVCWAYCWSRSWRIRRRFVIQAGDQPAESLAASASMVGRASMIPFTNGMWRSS